MNALQRLAASYPRLLYAIWNGATAFMLMVIAGLIFFNVIANEGVLILVLFPAVCAAASGAIFGRRLFKPSGGRGFQTGVISAIVAFGIYVLIYTTAAILRSSREEIADGVGWYLFGLLYGNALLLPLSILNGLSSWTLRRLCDAKRGQATPSLPEPANHSSPS